MGHEERGVADWLADGELVSPKDEGSHANPLWMFIVTCLHEGFPYNKVLSLDHAISLGVIWGNLDMMDPMFFGEVPCCSYECRTIVGDNFCHSTPPAEDILKYQVTKGLLIFLPKWAPLSPWWDCAMHLDKVLKLVYCWHEHGVYVNLVEKHRNVGNSWMQVILKTKHKVFQSSTQSTLVLYKCNYLDTKYLNYNEKVSPQIVIIWEMYSLQSLTQSEGRIL